MEQAAGNAQQTPHADGDRKAGFLNIKGKRPQPNSGNTINQKKDKISGG
jgi:hypothetical protein